MDTVSLLCLCVWCLWCLGHRIRQQPLLMTLLSTKPPTPPWVCVHPLTLTHRSHVTKLAPRNSSGYNSSHYQPPPSLRPSRRPSRKPPHPGRDGAECGSVCARGRGGSRNVGLLWSGSLTPLTTDHWRLLHPAGTGDRCVSA